MATASKFAQLETSPQPQPQSQPSLGEFTEQLAKRQANADIRNVLLAGLGLGAAARGGVGLGRLIHRNVFRRPPATVGPVVTPIPVAEEEHEKEAQVTNKTGVPYYFPAMVLGPMATGAMGWSAVDKLLDARRREEQQQEVAKARHEFEAALLSKNASALGQELDRLYDALEKQGMFGNLSGQAAGLYALYAGITGLLGGLGGYEIARKGGRRELFDKAQKKRLAARSQSRPAEIYAVPVPTRVRTREPEPPESEEEESAPHVLKMPGV